MLVWAVYPKPLSRKSKGWPEAGVALRIHFREQAIQRDDIAAKIETATTDKSFRENHLRQCQFSARAGSASKGADAVEGMLMFVHFDHLVPASGKIPFPRLCPFGTVCSLSSTWDSAVPAFLVPQPPRRREWTKQLLNIV